MNLNLSPRKRILVPALFFIAVSMPLLVEYVLESVYSQTTSSRYQITKDYHQFLLDHSLDHPFQDPPLYRIGKNTVQFQVNQLHREIFTDLEGTYQRLGDIVILLNGKEIDRLTHQILTDANPNSVLLSDSVFNDQSINRDVDAFVLKDLVSDQQKLVILMNISQGKLEKTPDGYHRYYPKGLKESQEFRMYTIRSDGTYRQEEFGYQSNRTYLQTHLAQRVSEIEFGHYTDWMYGWPSLFFPLIYPFGTGLLGILMLAFSFRRKV